VFLYACCAAPPAAAQRPAIRNPVIPTPLQVRGLQDLAFGAVLPGVVSTVTVFNQAQVGKFFIDGPAGAAVRVEFTLPPSLLASGGSSIALSFGPADGLATPDGGRNNLRFNPHTPVNAALGADGELQVRIGGRALPGLPQPSGNYHATIYITVIDLGT
jgi:hypothetical protein